MDDHLSEERLRRLIDVGRGLLSRLDPEAVLAQVLETAREITGARYAALGVLDRERRELERFIVRGIDDEASLDRRPAARPRHPRRADRQPAPAADPERRRPPEVLRLPARPSSDVDVPRLPVLVRGQVWGNLYLTEKRGGEQFDAADGLRPGGDARASSSAADS